MATYLVAKDGFLDRHILKIRDFYRERRDVMLEALDEHLPAGARRTQPEGGLFVWVTLPEGVDTRKVLVEALKEKVAFVPGQGFHADGSGANTMRLNFSTVPPDTLRDGVARLSRVIERSMEAVGVR